MPSLIAFGRPWSIASDDFVFPCLTEAIARTVWITVTVFFAVFQDPWSCLTYRWMPMTITLFVINVASNFIAVIMAYLSSRGSIMEAVARRHIATLMYIRLPIFLVEIISTIGCTVIIIEFFNADLQTCSFVISGLRWTIFFEWCLIVAFIFGISAIFNPSGGCTVDSSIIIEQSWKRRLFLFKFLRASQVRGAVDDVASLIASFFSESDLVFSDIVAGILLHIHSTSKKQQPQQDFEMENPTVKDWMKPPECFEVALRYLDFSSAIYAFPQYLVANCGCGSWFRLCRSVCCCHQKHRQHVMIIGDDCCSFSANALFLGIDDDVEPYFVSFHNRIFITPFAVLVDHKTRAILIVIRGSASFMDMITDLSFHEDFLDATVNVDVDPNLNQGIMDEESRKGFCHVDGDHKRVHRGMLNGARHILDVLREHQILEEVTRLHPDYQLRICGHSLGGGIGSLLTLMLSHEYPEVRCYAFSPPGSVISENGVADMRERVLSFILGDDVIPRITFHSLHQLKIIIENELHMTDKAKYQVLIKGIYKLVVPSSKRKLTTAMENDNRPLIHHNREPSNSTQTVSLSSTYLPASSAEPPQNDNRITEAERQRIQLRPAGMILHINVVSDDEIELKWKRPEAFSEIKLSGSMVRDHLPFAMRRALKMKKIRNSSEIRSPNSLSEQPILLETL